MKADDGQLSAQDELVLKNVKAAMGKSAEELSDEAIVTIAEKVSAREQGVVDAASGEVAESKTQLMDSANKRIMRPWKALGYTTASDLVFQAKDKERYDKEVKTKNHIIEGLYKDIVRNDDATKDLIASVIKPGEITPDDIKKILEQHPDASKEFIQKVNKAVQKYELGTENPEYEKTLNTVKEFAKPKGKDGIGGR